MFLIGKEMKDINLFETSLKGNISLTIKQDDFERLLYY